MEEATDYDELYDMKTADMTKHQKGEAIFVYQNDLSCMLAELQEHQEKDFNIDDDNVSAEQVLQYRLLNKLLSEAVGVATELNDITQKQNER